MRTHSTSTRIRRTVAVVVAGVTDRLLATVAVAANDRPETPSIRELQVERAQIADWANEHQLLRSLPGITQPSRRRRIIAIPARCRAGSHCRVGEGAGALRSLPGVFAAGRGMSRRTHRLIPHRRRVSTGHGTATAGVCVAALVSVLTGCGSGGAGDGTANQPGASVESPTATGPASTASDAQRVADGVGTTVSDRRRPDGRADGDDSDRSMSTAVWSRTTPSGRS